MNTNNILSIVKKLAGASLFIDGAFHGTHAAMHAYNNASGTVQEKLQVTAEKVTDDPTDGVEVVVGAELLGVDTMRMAGVKPKVKRTKKKDKKR